MKPVLLAIMAGVCWGVGEVFTRSVLHSGKIGPMTAVMIRTAIALPVMIAAWVVAVHVLKSKSEPAGWTHAPADVWAKLLLGSGVVAGGLALIFFYWALSLAEVSRIKPIAFGTAPALAVILGWLFLGEGLTLKKCIAVAFIVTGIVLLTGGSHTTSTSTDTVTNHV
ncbi:MAG: EamA family transporter [Phycisphaeraceae bacterium]|nr:EamA family transporter [Phycisphaerales bacterium]MCB9861359.1 EamA family transporter [Phycisphaeraceae bacterium]